MSRPGADEFVLTIACPDRPGIVSTVSHFLFDHGANVIHSDQHSTERGEGIFFMRIEFRLQDLATEGPVLETAFKPIAGRFGITEPQPS